MSTVIYCGAAILVFVTFLSIWNHDAWWVRMWDFPRAQIVFFGFALLVASLFVRPQDPLQKIIAGLLVACLVLQIWRIFPYTSFAASQSMQSLSTDGRHDVSLMVSNVLMDNRRSDRLLELVRQRNPDIFFAVETDPWWAEQLEPLSVRYPHHLQVPLDNTYGLVLYSRLELIDPDVRYLIEEDVPSVHSRVRMDTGMEFHLHLLHPRPPYPAESLKTTERDAEILRVGREIGEHDHPTVLAGDLNDVAWSHTTRLFQRLSGMLDPRIGRGLYSTFHAHVPFARWPLDHVFHSEHFKLVSLERLPKIGSDHFPIFARLNLEPTAPLEQDAPRPNPGDQDDAEEKIEEAQSTSDEDLDETLIEDL